MQKIGRVGVLYIIYALMFGLFLTLTITNGSFDIGSTAINVILFGAVGAIFYFAQKNMKTVQEMTNDLNAATERIEKDFEECHLYVWDKYKGMDAQELFKNTKLINAYRKYLYERQRLAVISDNVYKCRLSDYFNDELIDATIKKNVLNLIPGVMTGLGILGTFLGLTIGLQSFNTGNSEEIAASIAPLMNGIKVAFHTSIYGMMFSLSYNYIYKEILEDAYIALDNFMMAFDSYVDSDADADNGSTVQRILNNMPEAIGKKVAEIVAPAMDRMNDTLENFTKNIADSQVQGVAEIVDHFMESMNASLGDSFISLRETIDKTCELQQQNSEIMTTVLNEIQKMTDNIISINELSNKTVEGMAGYVEEIEELQKIINDNFVSAEVQLEYQKEYDEKLRQYIDILVNYERQIGEASNKFTEDMSKQLELLGKMENKISESTRENLEMLATKADDYNKTLTDVAKQQMQIVLSLATDYSEKVSIHLNDLSDMGEKLTEEATSNLDVLSTNAGRYNEILAEQAKHHIEEILSLSNSQTGDMDRAAQELQKVCKELNDKLSLSLNAAFKAIDENLAEITRHLSGTIAEIDDTTERVPQVVKNSYHGIKLTFDEMQKKYEGLISALELMTETINQYQKVD